MKCAPFPPQPHSRKQRSSRPGPSELDEWASVFFNSAGILSNCLDKLFGQIGCLKCYIYICIMAMVRTATFNKNRLLCWSRNFKTRAKID